ncbi:MAG TPA: hypothetical protein VFO25_08000 [Candidatus Eremiobacteraceae bacterium]|nr:hypothetical protein [Candidatus Eremiobacteraceae bacterium]
MDTVTESVAATESVEESVEKIDLTVFVRPSYVDDGFLAICYQWNLAASGKTPYEAFENLRDVVMTAAEIAEEGGEESFDAFVNQKPNAATIREFTTFKIVWAITLVFAVILMPAALVFMGVKLLQESLQSRFRKYSVPANMMLCHS